MKKIAHIILTVFIISCLLSTFSFAKNSVSYNESKEVLSAFKETVLTENYEQTEPIQTQDVAVLCSNTIEDDFSDNLIIAYIKRQYSAIQQTYTADDFPYIELTKIETVFEYIPEENNRVGLFLYLKESGKQNVLDAIELLEQDDKIQVACPDIWK